MDSLGPAAPDLQAAILAQLTEGVIVANSDGQITYVNEAAERLHGVAELGVEPESYSDTYHLFTEDGRPFPPADLPLSRALRGESVLDARWRIERPDGTSIMAIGSARPIRDGSGSQIAAVLTLRDDTEHEAAERQLKESEERFRLMADAVPQIVWITDAEGQVEFFNKQWSDYTGVPFTPTTAAEVAANHVHPDDGPSTAAAFEEVRRTGRPYLVEHRIRSADGGYRWFLVRGKPYRDPNTGEIRRWFGASVDIDDRKRAEAGLRELNDNLEQRVADALAERQVFAHIVESTQAAVLASDLDFAILAINAATAHQMERVYGIRPKVGDNLRDVLSSMPEHRAQVERHWGRALAGEEFAIVEEFGDPGRERAHYEVRFAPLRDRSGELIGAFQTAYDVTDRVRAQAELAAAQEALRQSQKMESLGQLTGGVAHDFNNLLTVIRGSADLLRHRELSPERRRRYIDAISDTADRAARLTSQLLAFARRQALMAEVFDVAARVEGVADMLRTMLGSRIEMAVETPPELCFIEADPGQFETALVNIALNARDAMNGEGRLTITIEPVDGLPPTRGHAGAPGAFVAVSLSDTGCGISPEQLERIFEPFFTTKAIGKGTGPGLSQVFGFAKQSSGDVTVKSQLGEGATFTIYLPRAEASQAAVPAGSGSAEAEGRGRVLVVEDNAQVGDFATQLLEDLGYQVDFAGTAEEAIRLLEADGPAFDVLFSDVVMPGIDGVELGRRVRERWPELPVVLTSGYSHVLAEDARHGFPLLHKPYSVEGLSRILRQAVSRDR